MGVQKNKTSKANKRMRRANDKLTKPVAGECPQCHAAKLPHHACPECGYYKGREVISKNA